MDPEHDEQLPEGAEEHHQDGVERVLFDAERGHDESREAGREASNYAAALLHLKRYAEARSLMSKTVPVARRVAGEDKYLTLMMRMHYARALYQDEESATLKDVREAVETLEDLERTARRVFGGEHPLIATILIFLREARATLYVHEGDVESLREMVAAMTPGSASSK